MPSLNPLNNYQVRQTDIFTFYQKVKFLRYSFLFLHISIFFSTYLVYIPCFRQHCQCFVSLFAVHLHVLTQEALDHADLTVLIGTIGAAALLKNCLWFYNQQYSEHGSNKKLESNSLKAIYKKYNEMGEALAERLLDLHCRLLCLYILQDADCLHWEDPKPFFESERGSYVIQMWWHYMQGQYLEIYCLFELPNFFFNNGKYV